MTDLVPAQDIEEIVGAKRHPTAHLARAVSAERVVYILHSQECLQTHSDLRTCPYSVALDGGVDAGEWPEDEPVVVATGRGRLLPELGEWPDNDIRSCVSCGCTDDRACVGGCSWVGQELCSRCQP